MRLAIFLPVVLLHGVPSCTEIAGPVSTPRYEYLRSSSAIAIESVALLDAVDARVACLRVTFLDGGKPRKLFFPVFKPDWQVGDRPGSASLAEGLTEVARASGGEIRVRVSDGTGQAQYVFVPDAWVAGTDVHWGRLALTLFLGVLGLALIVPALVVLFPVLAVSLPFWRP